MPLSPISLELYEPWQAFQQPLVRQLAFCIASPNILSHLPDELSIQHAFELHTDEVWSTHFQHYLPRLTALDRDPTPLIEFVARLKSTRLGLRFEMLMWFWLLDHAYHPYQLLGHSIQKIEGPRTIGELDFLILNQDNGQVEHWEVALKYYLGERDLSLPYWYGLNRSDTLARKLNHFTQKQFQFQDALEHPIERRFCVLKGQLYLPSHGAPSHLASAHTEIPLPAWVNPQRRLGTWGHALPALDAAFYRLQRHEWIYPNAQPSSATAKWWTDGLYKQSDNNRFYMYRQAPLLLNFS